MSEHRMKPDQFTTNEEFWAFWGAVQPGDRVTVEPGEYSEKHLRIPVSGTAEARILIECEDVTLEEGGLMIVQDPSFYLNDKGDGVPGYLNSRALPQFIDVQGLTTVEAVYPSDSHQLSRSGAWIAGNGIRLSRCVFADARFGGTNDSRGVRQSGSLEDFIMEDCEVSGFSAQAVSLYAAVRPTILRCKLFNIGGDRPIHSEHIAIFNVTTGYTIKDCTISHDGETATTGNFGISIDQRAGEGLIEGNTFQRFFPTPLPSENPGAHPIVAWFGTQGKLTLRGNAYEESGPNKWGGDPSAYLINEDGKPAPDPEPKPDPIPPPEPPPAKEIQVQAGDRIRIGEYVLEVTGP